MDALTREQLLDATEALHEKDDWFAAGSLRRPYVEQGDLEAEFRLAYITCSTASARKHKSAQSGESVANGAHPDAIYWLSRLCPAGEEKDALLRKASELGSLDAQRDLGVRYATGDWTGAKDLVQAAQWYHRAAERGHGGAQYNLGFMYLLGEGVPSGHEEGLRWLLLAAAQGEEQAMRLLADLYRHGFYGMPVDSVQAEGWDRKYKESRKGALT